MHSHVDCLTAVRSGLTLVAGLPDSHESVGGPALSARFQVPQALLHLPGSSTIVVGERGGLRCVSGAAVGGVGATVVSRYGGVAAQPERCFPRSHAVTASLAQARFDEIEALWPPPPCDAGAALYLEEVNVKARGDLFSEFRYFVCAKK